MNSPHTMPQTSEEADPRRWLALAILLLASFMNLVDVTIVNVALPSMQANLGANSSQIEWVVAAYVLSFALFLLPFGRLGDIFGRRRMFLAGVAAFTVGSALCGLAPSIETLIGARVLQGIAGALMIPQVLSIVQVMFPPKERGLAFSFFGLTAGLASVAGPIAGGLLISANLWGLDWRPIFLVNIPLGILAVAAALRLVPRITPHPGLTNDFVGIAIFGLSILAVVFPLVEGRTYGWPLWAFGLIAAGLAGLVLFYFWEKRRDRAGLTELLPVPLLENRNFVVGTLMTLVFFSGVPGLFMMSGHLPAVGLRPLALGIGPHHHPVPDRGAARFLPQRAAGQPVPVLAGRHRLAAAGRGHDLSALDHLAGRRPARTTGTSCRRCSSPGSGWGSPSRRCSSRAHRRAVARCGLRLRACCRPSSRLAARSAWRWSARSSSPGSSMPASGAPPRRHSAFVNAATNAAWYEIAAFLVVALMVPLIRRLPQPAARPGPRAATGTGRGLKRKRAPAGRPCFIARGKS